ncbi:MAG: hypothetical protein A2V66_17725 [Ignavibacteria bacterium RBG_13_36_8]|nr:MAG: hypothetical protein A2V66_17725 [Ignavibacteria bacterium RBG_13_36_8]
MTWINKQITSLPQNVQSISLLFDKVIFIPKRLLITLFFFFATEISNITFVIMNYKMIKIKYFIKSIA